MRRCGTLGAAMRSVYDLGSRSAQVRQGLADLLAAATVVALMASIVTLLWICAAIHEGVL